jgi:fructuronate reductase/mannitol 2-dehydrogenase
MPETAPRNDQTSATPLNATPLNATPLNDANLHRYAEGVQVPTYDRAALTPAVVHISVGGFTRAHQLVYLDELAEQGNADWGVVGVGLHSPHMRDALAPQDNLYTVVERDADAEHARVVGAMVDYVYAPDAPERVLDLLADERTRLVTMTVTGTAYRIDPQSGDFEPDEEARGDLEHPDRPSSVFGFLVEGLDRRRRAGLPPFTVLSCDNMQSNGTAARTAVVGFARLRDEVLARWIADQVAFPSSMVDRMTPTTSPEQRDTIAEHHGIDDNWPVITEPFSQWFVEDAFCNGRPPLEEVGARFVDDIGRYELMKTRLLNASHCAIGFLGLVAGLETTDQAVADPVFHDYLDQLMTVEVIPLLPRPAGVDLSEYEESLLRRFANPAIGDQLVRLTRRGSTKVPGYLLPSLRAALTEGHPHRLLTLAVAGWFRFLAGEDEAGRTIEVQDAQRDRLQELVRQGGTDPRPLLAERSLFGDLVHDEAFVAELEQALQQLHGDGVRATLQARLDEADPTDRRIDEAQPA